ncbi:ABC transporter permease [Herbiconiux ginsengi]|uniref:Monosaccharide ABC transporter membrane protein, CUT2 family n=1 Tax=Herbiconiux ginsengi TaxID=381665 RepID=A0A1H3TVG9_9MICO|nr:ABC transporter permease [Herbiconiux ginsengi]SDZ54048.1 monosaccharide ABC transporter membrane protein, CUT2 family [Herbiconiux ginsengi]
MTDTAPAAADTTSPTRTHRFTRSLKRYPIVQAAALVVVFLIGVLTLDGFGTGRSITNILITASFLGIAAAGQTLVALVGGIDMSIGAVISASAILTSYLYGGLGWPDVAVFSFVLVFALLLGAANGYIGQRFGANPLIVTLGSGFVAVGLAQVISGGGSDSVKAPEWLGMLSRPVSTTFGLPVPPIVVIWIALIVIVMVMLTSTPFGKRIYATGASANAARLALISVRWVWVLVFGLSSVLAAFAGILLAGFAGSGNTTLGDPYLFLGLAAVIVGGTTLDGRGDYLRTALAALLLVVVQTILVGFGFTNADRQIIFGLLLLVAVAGYIRQPRLRDLI